MLKNKIRSCRITRIHVAKKAGVSPSTVTRALNDHPNIPEKTKKKIRSISKKLGYVPSRLARGFFQNKSFRIGLVVPFETNDFILPYEYFSKTTAGIIRSSDKQGYHVSIINDHGLSKQALVNFVLNHTVDGMIFLTIKTSDGRFSYLFKKKIPFVFIHHYCEDKPYIYVDCDAWTGMEQAFAHAREKGVQRVGFLGGGHDYVNAVDREKIFSELSSKYGMQIAKIVKGNFSRRSGHEAAQTFLAEERPQLIFCANDRMALGLLQGFQEKNVRVPQDVKIIGFDNQEISRISSPPMTTIENPFQEIGEKAAEKLIQLIRGEKVQSESLASRLVVRGTA